MQGTPGEGLRARLKKEEEGVGVSWRDRVGIL